MIFEVLKILSQQVETYIDSTTEGSGPSVLMENVAMLESQVEGDTSMSDKILLSLINIKEESTLKNFPNKAISGNTVQTKNPIINLNLYILFSANRASYEIALRDISHIIQFFQGKKIFTQANTIYKRQHNDFKNIDNFKFTVELYTPTFEELNYIWGSLGGKQLPSVLYKLSLIQIEHNAVISQAGRVTDMSTDSKGN